MKIGTAIYCGAPVGTWGEPQFTIIVNEWENYHISGIWFTAGKLWTTT